MNYAQLFSELETDLEAVGAEPEALKFVYRQLKNLSYTDFILQLRTQVSQEDETLIKGIYSQLSQYVPAQYLLGWVDFCDLRLAVDKRVLIPRPETEELVSLILDENDNTTLRVLDIGTGSGAIALSLKTSRTNWQVSASDISLQALDVAKANARVHGLTIDFLWSDVFSQVKGKFDIIVSNPPYIDWLDRDEVGQNVLDFEPHTALFADDEGLAIYKKIAERARQYLTEQGKIYLEIGYKQGEAIKILFAQYFPNAHIRVLKDTFGHDRMVVVDNV